MTNEVALTFGTPQTTITHINSGKLKVLAVSSSKRSALFPQLPTIAESGLPGFGVDSWNGVFAPTATPENLITTLNSEIMNVVQTSGAREAMFKVGMEPIVTTPAEFSAIVKRDTQRWAKVIREKGISID
jgi:tripartite-type tricarboxylate transporter receptor subunit TctC